MADDFEAQFDSFATFGDRDHRGSISLKNSDKWMKQAQLFQKGFSATDTAIAFSKVARTEKRMNKKMYHDFLQELANSKKMDVQELKGHMMKCGAPGTSGTTRTLSTGAAASAMDRLTDHSKYTGTHKERFDESGKGKGIEGRYDIADNDGYVQGYKGRNTYDKIHSTDDEDEEQEEKQSAEEQSTEKQSTEKQSPEK